VSERQTTGMTSRYVALARRLGHRRWVAAIGRRLVPFDQWLERTSGGRISIAWPLPRLRLTTIGRCTGVARTTPLLYARDGADWIVTASNWGQPHHPGWSANLIANPDATIEVGREHVDVHATLATGADRDRLWAAVTTVWPAYNTYAQRAGREIRVFRLTSR
jgi:deazaflavin-dependent oxidoreductase (nitroreductase family)